MKRNVRTDLKGFSGLTNLLVVTFVFIDLQIQLIMKNNEPLWYDFIAQKTLLIWYYTKYHIFEGRRQLLKKERISLHHAIKKRVLGAVNIQVLLSKQDPTTWTQATERIKRAIFKWRVVSSLHNYYWYSLKLFCCSSENVILTLNTTNTERPSIECIHLFDCLSALVKGKHF